MADTTIIKPIGGKSPEEIALNLMEIIATVEDKRLNRAGMSGEYPADKVAGRKWILDTYAECLRASSGLR